jgi:thiol:disulfide interchange protein DsbD
MTRKFEILPLLLLPFSTVLSGQRLDPVHWILSSSAEQAPPGAAIPLQLTAKLDPGWHLYSLTTPKGGPIQTTAALAENSAVERVVLYQPKPERKFDPNFNLDTETFANEAIFLISAKLKNDVPTGPLELTAQVRYQACSDRQCLPPRKKTASFTFTVAPGTPAIAAFVVPAGYSAVDLKAASVTAANAASASKVPPRGDGLGVFMLTAFGLGLAAVFTPCVFPMIPITVSFFMCGRGGVFQATVFSFGIIALFCLLGLGVTAAVGPFGVVQLGASPWVNGFIAAVFGIFALSLLGAFEITLPSGLLTKIDAASRRGGFLGTLLMSLTFSLTSFACVGPFVGSLLAASVQTKGAQPVLGMMSFATGLASPFFVLAAFPTYLKKLPKSGGWLVRVKVVMGFVLLAALFKYLSNIDQVLQLGLITRDRFLAAWFVLFGLAGLYLLGFLRLEGIEAGDRLGIGRLLVASVLLIFSLSLLPGMFGSGLGELDAYVPAPQSGSILSAAGPAGGGAGGLTFLKDQYPEASRWLARSKSPCW